MKFGIGDKVVYPGQGAAIIRKISQKNTPSGETAFYILRMVACKATLMIPISNAQRIGLRKAVSREDLKELFTYLQDKPDMDYLRDWRAQERDYSNKIMGGSLLEIARIVKALYLRSQEQSLSFKRRKMLDHAWEVMVSEIAAVKGISQNRASKQVQRSLGLAQK